MNRLSGLSYIAAIAAQPDCPEAYCNLATAWVRLDDIGHAIADESLVIDNSGHVK